MTLIRRIVKIKEYRIFRDFSWPNEGNVSPFSKFNLIYGWNGSGKTSLSSLFALLEEGEIPEGVKFEIDKHDKTSIISSNDALSEGDIPIRVFNRDVVEDTVNAVYCGEIHPIFVIGKDSAKKQKALDNLFEDKIQAQKIRDKARDKKSSATGDIEYFLEDKAKLIKDTLLTSGLSSKYVNYNKRYFREAMEQPPAAGDFLVDAVKLPLLEFIHAGAKRDIENINIETPQNVTDLCKRISDLLSKKPSVGMLTLAKYHEIERWIGEGLSYHQGERYTGKCWFCDNEITDARLLNLEAHFNQDLVLIQRGAKSLIVEVKSVIAGLQGIIPDKEQFYSDLSASEGVGVIIKHVEELQKEVKQSICDMLENLQCKETRPREQFALDRSDEQIAAAMAHFRHSCDRLQSVVDKHNQKTKESSKQIAESCGKFVRHYVAESWDGYQKLQKQYNDATQAVKKNEAILTTTNNQIATIEQEIQEHHSSAEKLNQALQIYLGHSDINFIPHKKGYALMRGDKQASDLSEGERTAVALLYFLQKLNDKDFPLDKGIVVIDDPVSSLDAKSLFSSLAYMKVHTKDCQQLFVLTHNLDMFNLVRDWFFHARKGLKGSEKKCKCKWMYQLLVDKVEGVRKVSISPASKILMQAEYNVWFAMVLKCQDDDYHQDHEYLYIMPNVARRLLECFLGHEYPDDTPGNLWKQLEKIENGHDVEIKQLKMLDTYSHIKIHDPSLISKMPEIMRIVLKVIKSVNPRHYEEMEKLCKDARVF